MPGNFVVLVLSSLPSLPSEDSHHFVFCRSETQIGDILNYMGIPYRLDDARPTLTIHGFTPLILAKAAGNDNTWDF